MKTPFGFILCMVSAIAMSGVIASAVYVILK
jgi:hypothetical protein